MVHLAAARVDMDTMIKATVPGYARRWNPQTKDWTVAADWCDPLAETLAGDGYRVIGLSQQQRYDDWARSLFRLVDRRRRFRQPGM